MQIIRGSLAGFYFLEEIFHNNSTLKSIVEDNNSDND